MAGKPVNVAESKEEIVLAKRDKVEVVATTPDEDIIAWEVRGSMLFWNPYSFRELSDKTLSFLSRENAESYFAAKAKAQKGAEGKAATRIEAVSDPFNYDPSEGLRIRSRPGWHQTWKRPDEVEMAKKQGFLNIRKKSEEQVASEEEIDPGEEEGETVKVFDRKSGDIELLAMECPIKLYETHLKAVSEKSRSAFSTQKDLLTTATENSNRALGRDVLHTFMTESIDEAEE